MFAFSGIETAILAVTATFVNDLPFLEFQYQMPITKQLFK
jgi:hypothetical protein